jgi:hypothetical protein
LAAQQVFITPPMNTIRTIAILVMSTVWIAGQQSAPRDLLSDSAQRKLNHIQENAKLVNCDQAPTVITEEEINAYLASGRVKLPHGVRQITFHGQSGVITAQASIDFDEIAAQHSSNPLLSLFSGTRTVEVEADASGSERQGRVHVRSLVLDDVEVPQIALEFFLRRYVTPKYPSVGMDSEFRLPSRIDAATIGYHKLIVVQK